MGKSHFAAVSTGSLFLCPSPFGAGTKFGFEAANFLAAAIPYAAARKAFPARDGDASMKTCLLATPRPIPVAPAACARTFMKAR